MKLMSVLLKGSTKMAEWHARIFVALIAVVLPLKQYSIVGIYQQHAAQISRSVRFFSRPNIEFRACLKGGP